MTALSLLFPIKIAKLTSKSGELIIFIFSLALSVLNISNISLFSTQIEKALDQNSITLLGGNLVLSSYKPIDSLWLKKAKELSIKTSKKINFLSMTSFKDNFQLSSISAVDTNYPLAGKLILKKDNQSFSSTSPPSPGQAYLSPRLLNKLNAKLGDIASLGETQLKLTTLLLGMPDSSIDLINLSPKILINAQDLEKTKLIQPGSRINYQYSFLGAPHAIKTFISWLKPQLNKTIKLVTPKTRSSNIKNILKKTMRFLNLSTLLSVLLAGIAIFMSTNLFFEKQRKFIAILKTIGIPYIKIRNQYAALFLLMSTLSILLGIISGNSLRIVLLNYFSDNYFIQLLPAPDYHILWLSILTGFILTIGFSLPQLSRINHIEPLELFKDSTQKFSSNTIFLFIIALLSAFLIVILYSQDFFLTYFISIILFAIVAIFFMLSEIFKWLAQKIATHCQGAYKLSLTLFSQQTFNMKIQLMVFSFIIMLIVFMNILQHNLIENFQTNLPPKTPNYFLINISPQHVEKIKTWLTKKNISTNPLYPIIRGRITKLNGAPITEAIKPQAKNNRVLYRALNLTYTNKLPKSNEITQGQWLGQNQPQINEVSVGEKLGKQLGLKIGDTLTFSIGNDSISAKITSFRTIEWRTFSPNFFFIFNAHTLESMPSTYITSLYLPEEKSILINNLTSQFPNITVFDIADIIKKIQDTTTQINKGLALMGIFIILASFLILLVSTQSSLAENKKRIALLRMFGASSYTITWITLGQYSLLGACAGFIGSLGGNILALAVSQRLFQIQNTITLFDSLLGPCLGIIIITFFGFIANIKLLLTPPRETLRILL